MIPDKKTHKATITNNLRFEISCESERFDEPTYLEIGFDRGYTMKVLSEDFSSMIGIDNNSQRYSEASELLKENNAKLILGTVENLEEGHFDIVLIDAAHDYKNAKNDLKNILLKNTSNNYSIFMHDYGLVGAGVKQVVNEVFEEGQFTVCGEKDNWNPLGGPICDWEAVCIRVTKEIKDKALEKL